MELCGRGLGVGFEGDPLRGGAWGGHPLEGGAWVWRSEGRGLEGGLKGGGGGRSR